MDYDEEIANLRETRPDLSRQIAGFRTLEHVLNWMTLNGYAFASLDMVTQDEYCHDLLMPIKDDWLVFGMT